MANECCSLGKADALAAANKTGRQPAFLFYRLHLFGCIDSQGMFRRLISTGLSIFLPWTDVEQAPASVDQEEVKDLSDNCFF